MRKQKGEFAVGQFVKLTGPPFPWDGNPVLVVRKRQSHRGYYYSPATYFVTRRDDPKGYGCSLSQKRLRSLTALEQLAVIEIDSGGL